LRRESALAGILRRETTGAHAAEYETQSGDGQEGKTAWFRHGIMCQEPISTELHSISNEIVCPCDFIARITQHIPDKSFQLVRYYGQYSSKMRGQRLKRADTEAVTVPGGEVNKAGA